MKKRRCELLAQRGFEGEGGGGDGGLGGGIQLRAQGGALVDDHELPCIVPADQLLGHCNAVRNQTRAVRFNRATLHDHQSMRTTPGAADCA